MRRKSEGVWVGRGKVRRELRSSILGEVRCAWRAREEEQLMGGLLLFPFSRCNRRECDAASQLLSVCCPDTGKFSMKSVKIIGRRSLSDIPVIYNKGVAEKFC